VNVPLLSIDGVRWLGLEFMNGRLTLVVDAMKKGYDCWDLGG
jgi:hypothetical protein